MSHTPVLIARPDDTNYRGWERGWDDRIGRWKTRPRFLVPTPYQRYIAVGNPSGAGEQRGLVTFPMFNAFEQPYRNNGILIDSATNTDLYNKAYGRLVGMLQNAGNARGNPSPQLAELGVTFLEYSKTADWVKESIEAIRDYTEALKVPYHPRLAAYRERVYASRRRKNRKPRPLTKHQEKLLLRKKWGVPRWLSSRWLEYWMVVAPTIGDLHSGLQALHRDVQLGFIFGTAHTSISRNYIDQFAGIKVTDQVRGRCGIRLGCHVVCRNPNLSLAQSLGLLNPLTTGLELVPWTWLIGWFVNWKAVLGAWTDFAGYQVTLPYQTSWIGFEGEYYFTRDYGNTWRRNSYAYSGTHRYTQPLAFPTLTVRLPNRLSIERAATSMSLVVNLLTS